MPDSPSSVSAVVGERGARRRRESPVPVRELAADAGGERQIDVRASVPADRRLVDALIERAGLRGDAVVPSATIVCHRASTVAPRPILPEGARVGRIVVLSDCSSEPVVVATLEAGAHHYLDIDEPPAVLSARLAAALRSRQGFASRVLSVPPFRFDPIRRLAWRDGRPAALSPKEFGLAYYLFINRGRNVDKRELMTVVWSLPRMMDSRRIDTAASRVRKKLGLGESRGWRLERRRRVGYRLLGPGQA